MKVNETKVSLEDRVFTDRNMRIVAVLWFIGYATLLGRYFVRYHWPLYSKEFSSGCVDFGWVWLSGRFAIMNEAARVFDYAAFTKAQVDLFGTGNCSVIFPFPYPPILLLITAPFGLFAFVTAYVLWSVLLTAFFAGAVYVIVRRINAAIAAPATFPAIVNLYIGQTAFLTAGLFGFALTALERRPIVAGFFFAMLTFKPQYGIMIPIALLASRNWRALISAAGFSLILALVAALAFGGWPAFFANLIHRDTNLSPDSAFHLDLASIYGIVQSAGLGVAAAWAAQAALVLGLAVLVWKFWSHPTPHALRASLLCVASVLASPYVLYYDVCVLSIAFAFLVTDGLKRGFVPVERTIMFVCWEAFSVGMPGAMISCALLLWLLYRRISEPVLVPV